MSVRVHWNLHRKCWSVKQGREATTHASRLTLSGCTFVVSACGRERCLRDGHRNVHAFVKGEVSNEESVVRGVRVGYNPWRSPHFTRKDNGEKVEKAGVVFLSEDGQLFARLED